MTEATIVVLIGGGIGYLFGLSWYPIMSSLPIALEVRQKVSWVWCVAAIGTSMAAVLTGAITVIIDFNGHNALIIEEVEGGAPGPREALDH